MFGLATKKRCISANVLSVSPLSEQILNQRDAQISANVLSVSPLSEQILNQRDALVPMF